MKVQSSRRSTNWWGRKKQPQFTMLLLPPCFFFRRRPVKDLEWCLLAFFSGLKLALVYQCRAINVASTASCLKSSYKFQDENTVERVGPAAKHQKWLHSNIVIRWKQKRKLCCRAGASLAAASCYKFKRNEAREGDSWQIYQAHNRPFSSFYFMAPEND